MALEEQMKKFNVNNPIMVKLTDKGMNIYYHQYDDLNRFYGKEMIKPKYPKNRCRRICNFSVMGVHDHFRKALFIWVWIKSLKKTRSICTKRI